MNKYVGKVQVRFINRHRNNYVNVVVLSLSSVWFTKTEKYVRNVYTYTSYT